MDKQKHLDELFRKAKEQNPVVTFKETKEHFLTSGETNFVKSNGKKGSFLITKKLIIMIVTVSTLIIALFLSNNHERNISSSNNYTQNQTVTNKIREEKASDEVKSNELSFKLFESLPEYKKRYSKEDQTMFYFPFVISDSLKIQENLNLIKTIGTIISDEYNFPKLTEEEIKTNEKQKRQMLKALEKFDKKVYAYIATGTFDYLAKQTSVQSFYMQKTEVSNLEYRTFLFDLLIQGRKDEFLIAKPDQSQWSKTIGPENSSMGPMEELYFSHPAFNAYPVCNVSREAVELYCKWLTQELIKTVDPKKRGNYNDIRIPGRVEWVFAASNEGKSLPYPWGGPFLRNHEGCYLANFKPLPENYHDDGGYFTVKVDSYLSNEFGLFNMSGNVSEMVYNAPNSRKEPGTAGGGWMNDGEELKILGTDPYEGIIQAHPNIGFRVVMTVKKQM